MAGLDDNYFIPVLADPVRTKTGPDTQSFVEPLEQWDQWRRPVFPDPYRTKPWVDRSTFVLPLQQWDAWEYPVYPQPNRAKTKADSTTFVTIVSPINVPPIGFGPFYTQPDRSLLNPSEPSFVQPLPPNTEPATTSAMWGPVFPQPERNRFAPQSQSEVNPEEETTPDIPYNNYPDLLYATPGPVPGGWFGTIYIVPTQFYPDFPDLPVRVPLQPDVPIPFTPFVPDINTITFTLAERTPHRLRYIITTTGSGLVTGILPNTGGPSPDLRGDAEYFGGLPIDQLVSTPVADQAGARRLLFGDSLTTKEDLERIRASVTLYARSTNTVGPWWSVDAEMVGGFAVLRLSGAAGTSADVEIFYQHTYDR